MKKCYLFLKDFRFARLSACLANWSISLSGRVAMTAGENRGTVGILHNRGIYRLVSVLVVLIFMSACGYHFAGSASNRLAAGQSLWVSFIGIEIDSPSAQTVLRRALLEECHALRGLYPADSAATADL